MTPGVLDEQKSYTIHFDEQEYWLYVDWIGFQSMRSILQGCEEVLVLMVQHQARYILNDNRHLTGVWSGAPQYGATSWFPRLRAAGLHSLAWVYSPELMARVCADFVLDQMEAEAMGVKIFEDIESAQDWLRRRRDSL